MATQTMEGGEGAVEVSWAWRVTWDDGRGGARESVLVMARDCSDAVVQARESGLVGVGARVVAVRREGRISLNRRMNP